MTWLTAAGTRGVETVLTIDRKQQGLVHAAGDLIGLYSGSIPGPTTASEDDIMRKPPLVLAIVSFLLAIVVFVFAGGARSIYSGLFFAMLGVVLLVTARRR